MRILLVEADEFVIHTLRNHLENQHYVVDVVRSSEAGWRYASTFDYGLILLGGVPPELSGICLCQRLRTEGCKTPMLLLMTEDTSAAKIAGLDAGADDYVVKPFDLAELSARIRALLRRSKANPSPILTWEQLLLNPSTCEVSYNGQPLTLTAKEYELLELLLRDSQHVFSTDEILDSLWSSEEFPAEATVRSHIRRLRHKLTAVGAPDLIATVHGRGYYLRSPTTTAEGAASGSAARQASNLGGGVCSCLMLIVDHDPKLTQPLVEQAARANLRTAIAPTAAAAWAWFNPVTTVDVVLVRLTNPNETLARMSIVELNERQKLVQMLTQQSISVLTLCPAELMTDAQTDSLNRQRFLATSASTTQIMMAIDELVKAKQNS